MKFRAAILIFCTLLLPLAGWTENELPADRVVVKKSERKMYLLNNGRIIREYPISLGQNPIGHKQQRGDQRTPEGIYVLNQRNSTSKYYKSILFSYPNDQDRRQAADRGVDPGGDLAIHGLPVSTKEEEWDYMFHPVSYQKWAYTSSVGVCLDKDLDFFQWQFVRGWVDILPGLRLIPAPGHTPGHQVVMVQTEEGKLIVTGDSVNMLDNLETNLPSAIFSDGHQYMDSMQLVRDYADFIIAGHEIEIEPFQTGGFPKVQPLAE